MGPTQEDAIISTQLNSNLKYCISMAATSAAEAATPELRETFALLCQDAIRRHAALLRLMEERGWYVAPDATEHLIGMLIPQLQQLTSATVADAPRR